MDENRFRALIALLVSIVTGLASFIGLPPVVTPELIGLTASAISSVAAVVFYLRRAK